MAMTEFPYPITIRILNGWIEISAPDFQIVKAKKKFSDVQTADEIGMLTLEVMKECRTKLDSLHFEKKPIPAPSRPRGIFERELDFSDPMLGTQEVQEILNVSHETIRRLCNSGELSCVKTRGGHRRFKSSDVRMFLENKDKEKRNASTVV
jgi:excisionase family DNA binding protein